MLQQGQATSAIKWDKHFNPSTAQAQYILEQKACRSMASAQGQPPPTASLRSTASSSTSTVLLTSLDHRGGGTLLHPPRSSMEPVESSTTNPQPSGIPSPKLQKEKAEQQLNNLPCCQLLLINMFRPQFQQAATAMPPGPCCPSHSFCTWKKKITKSV